MEEKEFVILEGKWGKKQIKLIFKVWINVGDIVLLSVREF